MSALTAAGFGTPLPMSQRVNPRPKLWPFVLPTARVSNCLSGCGIERWLTAPQMPSFSRRLSRRPKARTRSSSTRLKRLLFFLHVDDSSMSVSIDTTRALSLTHRLEACFHKTTPFSSSFISHHPIPIHPIPTPLRCNHKAEDTKMLFA